MMRSMSVDRCPLVLVGLARARAGLRLLAGVAAAIARERRMRHDIALLSRQSDYLLHDIGLTRGDIAPRVRGRTC